MRPGVPRPMRKKEADQKDERPPYGKRLLNSSPHKIFQNLHQVAFSQARSSGRLVDGCWPLMSYPTQVNAKGVRGLETRSRLG